ncbi:SDR family oxidoreductase [Gammaproteobacteria bacterium]|jgi:3-oxoacyl-[acyl-carrier protein] reductase|nr:SDR family oxidoreductase [Gammaproteobacteria bacterium]
MKLENKVAIVTGGSRGIGKAISKRFAGDGARLVVNYRDDADAAGELVDDIRAAGGEAISVQADVSRRPDTDRLCASTLEAFGVIDILVSNAGIIIDRPYIESTDDDWQSAMDTNLRGFFNVTQSVLPHMIDRKYGRIIATGSIINEVADFGGNKYSVCAASKGGIHGMLRPIAAEMARHGITVNSVSPGYIATEMLEEIDAAGVEEALRLVPMRRYGKPDEIAAAMAFLASDDAAYITGQTLRVNGGMSMN